MKILGIDYGEKRIGLAISDAGMKFAFPHRLLENNSEAIEEIGKVVKAEKIFEIVVGDTLNMDGTPNAITPDLEDFITELGHKFQIPIRKEKEFLTSVEARRYETGGGKVDASAAALILQRFLDKRNNGVI